MSLRHTLASALLFTALFACSGAESGESSAGKADAALKAAPAPVEPPPVELERAPEVGKPADAETETGDDEAEPVVPVPATFEQVGVDVCDQYVADYGKCIDAKVPEAEREASRRLVFENVTVWKQTASAGPAGQKSLQTACRIAREQAKRATESLNCEW